MGIEFHPVAFEHLLRGSYAFSYLINLCGYFINVSL